jgi:uncharacterized protein
MNDSAQAETIAFLGRSEAYGELGTPVERLQTHISLVFLVGMRAFKLKRAVTFSYLDFSTPALRRRYCEAELRLGRAMAPQLYRAVHAVTRESSGRLALDGAGPPVDWLVEMRRFDQETLFERLAKRGALTPALMRELADVIAAFHAAVEPAPQWGEAAAVRRLIGEIVSNLGHAGTFPAAELVKLAANFDEAFERNHALIERRNLAGKVRRCHGDLHLRNICLIEGAPVLFDPIEFSEAIASTDVLYDLAFLLMDLIHEGLGALANLVFNRYLNRTDEDDGLPILPLFLAMRAAVRAHVSAAADETNRARSYFRLAGALLEPGRAMLAAIGGVSGTGKSTLAQAVAADLGRVPGARILRSDVIRKRLHGVAPEQRLPNSAYDKATSLRVYETLNRKATAALAAGQAVIADAAFLRPEERAAIAAAAGADFAGFWLTAPKPVLARRLAMRRGDASDADLSVLNRQLAQDHGAIDWIRLDASGDVAALARVVLAAINRA